ncbi:Holliday junction resolvasome RuvABC endonuclease subunit [Bradyrhizobium huanghuaihaiense]
MIALSKRLCASAFWLLPFVGIPTNASADLLGIVAGRTIDHAMDRADQIVDRARQAALAIEAQTNTDVSNRLKQVQEIANDAQKQIFALEQQTFADMNALTNKIDAILREHEKQADALEHSFMNDLSKKIREVQCATDVILQQQLKDALGKIGVAFGANEITITPPVLYEGEHSSCGLLLLRSCRVSQTFTIYTPFTETYKEIKIYLEKRLSAVREDTPVASVIDMNALIADMAKRTTCFTMANDETYEGEFVKYSALVRRWNTVLVLGGQL